MQKNGFGALEDLRSGSPAAFDERRFIRAEEQWRTGEEGEGVNAVLKGPLNLPKSLNKEKPALIAMSSIAKSNDLLDAGVLKAGQTHSTSARES